jgi:hypothetical protein
LGILAFSVKCKSAIDWLAGGETPMIVPPFSTNFTVYVFNGWKVLLSVGLIVLIPGCPGKKGFVQVKKMIPAMSATAVCFIRFFIIILP